MFSKISKIGLPNKDDRIEKLTNQLNFSLFKLEEQLPIEFQKDIKADREHVVKLEVEAKDKREKAYKGLSKNKRRKTSICNLLPTNFNVRGSINNMNNNDLIKYRSKRSSLNLDTENSSVKPMKSVKINIKNSKFDSKEILVSDSRMKKSVEFDFYPEYHLEAHKKESFLQFNDDYVLNTNKNVNSNKLSTAFNSIDVKSINNISNKSKDNSKTANYLNADKKVDMKDSILKTNAKQSDLNSVTKKLNIGALHLSDMKNCITESIVNHIRKTSNFSKEDREGDSITTKNIIKEELELKDIDYLETIDYNKRKNNEKLKNNLNTIESNLSSSLALKANKTKINNKILSSNDVFSNKFLSKKNDINDSNLNFTKKKATLSFKINNFDFNNNDKIENLPKIQLNQVKGKYFK